MKRFFGLLNLILCLELIIGPHFPGTKIFTSEVAKAETCPSGLIFDSTLNRCITSDQNASLINATASCNGDRECYKRLAEEELKKGEEEGKITAAVKDSSGLFNKAIGIAAIAAPLLAAYTTISMPNACGSTSRYAMMAGGVAQLAGHVMTMGKHKKCLEKIKKDWEEKKTATDKTSSSSSTSKVSVAGAQSEAFEMLAKSEECTEKTAKTKATFYAISAAAFAASAVLAGLEMMRETVPVTGTAEIPINTCPASASYEPHSNEEAMIADYQAKDTLKSSLLESQNLAAFITLKENFEAKTTSCASIERYEELKGAFESANIPEEKELLVSFKEASRVIWREANIFHVPEAEAVVTMAAVKGFLVRPLPRLIISGVLAGWSAMMWMHANKQARASKNRAEFLRKLKDQFNDANGAISCTAEERSTSANANCYCYTEGGQRNTARSNSQVCQQLFAGTTLGKPGDYSTLPGGSERVCIAQNGSADAGCSCAKTRSCLNAIPGGVSNLGIGAISAANAGLTPTNDIASGKIAAGDLNGAATLGTAARLLTGKKDLEKKLKLDPKKLSKLTKDIEGALIAGGAGTPSPLMADSSLPMNMSPSQAAQALEKELGGERSFERVSGSPAVGQPGNSTPGDDAGFSLGTAEPVAPSQDSQLAEVMKQDLNYDQADITKSNSNLFQILSNRYQRSGMRRLFEENEKPTPEASNKNDINQ